MLLRFVIGGSSRSSFQQMIALVYCTRDVFSSRQQAAQFGEFWVTPNGDGSICQLQGLSRPIINKLGRAYRLSALECVTRISIFPDQYLAKELENFCPNIYVKSSDYALEILNT
jgi:bifunctional ADP-heptose synthase (sugar kinase/adenylyltransferase)